MERVQKNIRFDERVIDEIKNLSERTGRSESDLFREGAYMIAEQYSDSSDIIHDEAPNDRDIQPNDNVRILRYQNMWDEDRCDRDPPLTGDDIDHGQKIHVVRSHGNVIEYKRFVGVDSFGIIDRDSGFVCQKRLLGKREILELITEVAL